MSRLKVHLIIVEVETLDAQGSHAAEDRVLRWLETFGYTSVSHGFEFKSVGRVAKKTTKHRIRPPTQEASS